MKEFTTTEAFGLIPEHPLEKTAVWLINDGRPAPIYFYAVQSDVWQCRLSEKYKFICMSAPSWFGSQYNMVYDKKMIHTNDWGWCLLHGLTFYHSDDKNFFPFEKYKWIY